MYNTCLPMARTLLPQPIPLPLPCQWLDPPQTTLTLLQLPGAVRPHSAILNALLTLLNERLFDNGAARVRVPLLCLVRRGARRGRGRAWSRACPPVNRWPRTPAGWLAGWLYT